MRSRTLIAGTAVVVALLVTAGIAGAWSPGQQAQPATQEQPQSQTDAEQTQNGVQEADDTEASSNATIEVAASDEVQAQADRAVVRVAITSSGDDVEAVREDLAENASSVRDALAEIGLEDDQIRTAYYDISSNQPYRAPEEDQPEYSGTHAFEMTVNETERAGEVIDTAVTNGANEIDNVDFTLSAEKRADLRERALERAMDGARSEADTVAASEDLTITGVHEITTTEYNRTPSALETAAAGDAGGDATAIDGGPVTVSASVTVLYEGGPTDA